MTCSDGDLGNILTVWIAVRNDVHLCVSISLGMKVNDMFYTYKLIVF